MTAADAVGAVAALTAVATTGRGFTAAVFDGSALGGAEGAISGIADEDAIGGGGAATSATAAEGVLGGG